jgi:hypothetical protein
VSARTGSALSVAEAVLSEMLTGALAQGAGEFAAYEQGKRDAEAARLAAIAAEKAEKARAEAAAAAAEAAAAAAEAAGEAGEGGAPAEDEGGEE